MSTAIRIWAIAVLLLAVFSEAMHYWPMDTPEHPRPTGWRQVGNVGFSISSLVAVLVLVVT